MIDLKDVSKAYPNGVHALNHVNLHIDKGEFVYVIGIQLYKCCAVVVSNLRSAIFSRLIVAYK